MKLKENTAFIYYLPSLLFGVIAILTFHYQLLNYYLLLIISFGIIPIFELFLKSKQSISSLNKHFAYDLLLYFIVVLQYIILLFFLYTVSTTGFDIFSGLGIITAMGICCGVYGINVAHELGHKLSSFDRTMARALLLSSLYMHFYIEHNRGHHKRVGTPDDPATARRGENLYSFWIRSIRDSFLSAYHLEAERLKRNNDKAFSLKNAVVSYTLLEIIFIIAIYYVFGSRAMWFFMASAVFGILLLETINYIEHYGLQRKRNERGIYNKVEPIHSWNSDHILGRYLLFELTRHSDHHENSLKKYPQLESKDNAPQLPTGYPGMMILSLIPALWFKVMNKRLY